MIKVECRHRKGRIKETGLDPEQRTPQTFLDVNQRSVRGSVEQNPCCRSKKSTWARDEHWVTEESGYRKRMDCATSFPPIAERSTQSNGNELTDTKRGSHKVHNLLQNCCLEQAGLIYHDIYATAALLSKLPLLVGILRDSET